MSVTLEERHSVDVRESADSDILAGLLGGTDRADELGEVMIDQSIAPTAGAIVALSRLANC